MTTKTINKPIIKLIKLKPIRFISKATMTNTKDSNYWKSSQRKTSHNNDDDDDTSNVSQSNGDKSLQNGHISKNKPNLGKIYKRVIKDYIWKRGEHLSNCQVLAIGACLIASKTIDAQSGLILKNIVNKLGNPVLDGDLFTSLRNSIILYGSIRIGASILHNFGNFLASIKSLKAYQSVANLSFMNVLTSPFLFHSSKWSGKIIRSIERGTSGINSLVQLTITSIMPTFYQISLVMGMISYQIGSIHALIILSTIGLYSLYTFLMTIFRMKIRKKVNHHDNIASAYLTDTLINIEAVKIFQKSGFESKAYHNLINNVMHWSKLQNLTLSALNAGQTFIFASGFTLCQYLTLDSIFKGILTVGDLVLINTLMWQIYSPLFYMGMLYRETTRSLVDISNLFSTLDASKSEKIEICIDHDHANGNNQRHLSSTDNFINNNKIHVTPFDFQNLPIILKNVSLSYPEKKDVLTNFNLRIEPKSKIGIVGLSGSGKTSIIRLIFGLIQPSSGSIYLGNKEIKEIDLDSWQNNISIVTQDSMLFNRSILENIQYGNLECDLQTIQTIARDLKLGNLIDSLQNGINSRVGEKGSKLSGGERQRICIARSLIKDSQILIFDEASSALDAFTEQIISDLTLKSDKYSQKTSIFITHHLKTIEKCDCIYLINNCGVLESGTHNELLSIQNGLYKEMWHKQQHTFDPNIELDPINLDH